MAAAALVCHISVAEYLATSYRPDCDYIDGEVLERNLGEKPHAGLQGYLGAIFFFHEAEWKLIALPEWRVQVSPTRFRVPDLCAIRPEGPTGPILLAPPLLCVEILSPGDTLSTMQRRVDDYVAFGVANIWLVDPVARLAWTADGAGIHSLPHNGAFTIENTPVRIPLADLYARLDKLEAGI